MLKMYFRKTSKQNRLKMFFFFSTIWKYLSFIYLKLDSTSLPCRQLLSCLEHIQSWQCGLCSCSALGSGELPQDGPYSAVLDWFRWGAGCSPQGLHSAAIKAGSLFGCLFFSMIPMSSHSGCFCGHSQGCKVMWGWISIICSKPQPFSM